MTPKEKCDSLIDICHKVRYNDDGGYSHKMAKHSALVCVDEILKQFVGLHKPEYVAFDCIVKPRQFTFEGEYETHMTGYDMQSYWEEVKKEIEKL